MTHSASRRHFLAGGLAATALAGLSTGRAPAAEAAPATLGIDYAYYNPPSLVLKKFGWLEAALGAGTRVDWVLSLGSNKANGFLQANAVQFGSTAGSAALLARANGAPIKTVYLFSQPEWTALVVPHGSPLRGVRDLGGKKIAATKGTDPYFFLLRALQAAGMKQTDVEIVELQHPDGRKALESGQVDAWAGLDPHMAASELDARSVLLYRNKRYNSFGALNVREDFLQQFPATTTVVLRAYQRARDYAAKHVDETAQILADASGLELRVAQRQLHLRTFYPSARPGNDYRIALAGVAPIVRDNNLALPGADVDAALASLVDLAPSRAAGIRA